MNKQLLTYEDFLALAPGELHPRGSEEALNEALATLRNYRRRTRPWTEETEHEARRMIKDFAVEFLRYSEAWKRVSTNSTLRARLHRVTAALNRADNLMRRATAFEAALLARFCGSRSKFTDGLEQLKKLVDASKSAEAAVARTKGRGLPHPNRFLVERCWKMAFMFSGRLYGLSNVDDSPLVRFARAVHEYATGRAPAGLYYHADQLRRALKK